MTVFSIQLFSPFWRRYVLLLIGLLFLAIPTIWSLTTSLWTNSDQEHGPIMMLVFGWVLYRESVRLQMLQDKGNNWGWVFVLPALLVYMIGRSQQIWILEIGAFIPLLAGCAILAKGRDALRPLYFPLLILMFSIPLPGPLLNLLTTELKQHVSILAESLLYSGGYPIARSGVILTIGPYQLLVADACSGLNTLFSLFAVGLLYIYLQANTSRFRNFLLLLIIAPVAIFANVVRVIILVLLTYYWGEDIGQGYLHGFAGIILFAIALMTMFLIDTALSILFTKKELL